MHGEQNIIEDLQLSDYNILIKQVQNSANRNHPMHAELNVAGLRTSYTTKDYQQLLSDLGKAFKPYRGDFFTSNSSQENNSLSIRLMTLRKHNIEDSDDHEKDRASGLIQITLS